MKRSCTIICKAYGLAPPQASWKNVVPPTINRLYYVTGGKSEYIENGIIHPFEIGKLYLIPSYAGVPTYTDDNDRMLHAYVNFELSPPIVSDKVFCIDPSTSPVLKTATETLVALCKKTYNRRIHVEPLTHSEELEHSLLSSLTVFLVENAIQQHPEYLHSDPTVITALNIMHTSLKDKPTVSYIAEKCCMSTDGFIRKFTRYVGETPSLYLKKLKIRTALSMRNDGATLEEAADACGYSDASSLLHAIRSSEET